MKKCVTCKKDKADGQFYRYANGRLFSDCKKCYSKKGRVYRQENKDAVTRRHMARRLRLRYGIDVEMYDDLLEYQKGVCAICGKPDPRKMLGVDHNHETGKVRGLLCHSCNVLIGHAREDVEILKKAVAYLESKVVPTKRMWVGDNDHEPEKSGWQDIPIIR